VNRVQTVDDLKRTISEMRKRKEEERELPLVSVLIHMLELAMAALFLYLGGTKLLGSPAAVRLFHDYGWGQWFRYVTGVVELAGALLLIVPRLARASALMAVMVVAMGIELFVLHRPPVAATACLSAHGIIAWKRQGARLRQR
jgi:uncharacterized membrane protein YphA (DoxX/SURF4 family)